jgi:hypothetical protein
MKSIMLQSAEHSEVRTTAHAGASSSAVAEARAVAAATHQPGVQEWARSVARASPDLAMAREAKMSLINQVVRFGRLHRSYRFSRKRREMQRIDDALKAGPLPRLRRVAKAKPLPRGHLAADAEAYCRPLADLSRIERYEIRASAELCGALRKLLSSSGAVALGNRADNQSS